MSSENAYSFYPVQIDSHILQFYGRQLNLRSSEAAFCVLAGALAGNLARTSTSKIVLISRIKPYPVLAIFGPTSQIQAQVLVAQTQALQCSCSHLMYIRYSQVESACERLAELIINRIGHDALRQFHYVGLPRGGYIVLGLLTYLLQVRVDQLDVPTSLDVPLIVVDDCALSGARFRNFLRRCPSQQVVFAPLYSHPDLRAAILACEPRVLACLSAHDLRDHGPETYGAKYPTWREQWRTRLGDTGYWIGQPDHICFPWNEPNRNVWDPITEEIKPAWKILPSEWCLKNRLSPGLSPVPVQTQPEGKGPLAPSARVVFCEINGQTIIGDLETGKSFGLTDVAADLWRGIVVYGNLGDVLDILLKEYAVDESTLRADLTRFVDDLLARGLLE
jgi:hypothetical protein